MGSTLLAVLAAIAALGGVAFAVIFAVSRLKLFRAERPTTQMKSLSGPPPASSAFVKTGVFSGSPAEDPGQPRLRETSAPAWAARLVVLSKSEITIGRSLDNDIVLPDDPVSAEHCRLERRDDGWRLIDRGSTNKTWLNGQPTGEATLRDGDQIRVGLTTFVFEAGEDQP